VQWLWPAHEPGAIGPGSHLGRRAVGGAPGHVGVSAAPRRLPALWRSDRARRVRGPEGVSAPVV